MVTIGADLHKRTHTVVAVDDQGRRLAERTVAATPAGHLELLAWAQDRYPERRWALEDCRHLSRRLERDLVTAGESVVRVPPKLMAGARRSSREPGKSDPIDALAVARAALREPGLPVARLDGPERELRLLVDHRLEREIEGLVRVQAPTLLALPGCGPLTAAKLVGETAGIGRFHSAAAFARHNGSAPVPVWSANSGRHRLSRTGNRQLNLALHRIAITQMRLDGRGRDYLAKRLATGDTKTEAIRALRRRISDEVFRRMLLDSTDDTARQDPLAMAA